MNTNNKKEWERIVSRAHMDINGHCPLAEDEAIIETDKQIKQLEQEYELCKLANKSLKDALDDERKIIEAQKYVMEAFQKERDSLKAHCSDLEVELEYHIKPCDCCYPKICAVCRNNKDIEELLCRDLGISHQEIQASAIETMIDSMDWSKGISPEDCYDYAKQLREGAK